MDNQLSKFENNRILEIIKTMPDLTDEDRRDLQFKMASDDVELKKQALKKLTKSQLAQHDLATIMGELTALNKKGMYIKSKQTVETGSGKFEIEVKGGDTKLIVPVLIIVGIVLLVALFLVFGR
jgi:hypothetical protein